MNVPLTICFTPNKSDFYKTLRAFSWHQRSIKIIVLGVSLIALIGIILTVIGIIITFNNYHSLLYNIIFVLMFLLLIIYAIFFYGPANVADKIAKDEKLRSETSWIVTEDKVAIKNSFSETSTDWSIFGGVFETPEHYMITYSSNKNMYQFIPKRSFQSTGEQVDFRKLLETKIKPVKQIQPLNLPEFSKKTCQILFFGLVLLFVMLLVLESFIRTNNAL